MLEAAAFFIVLWNHLDVVPAEIMKNDIIFSAISPDTPAGKLYLTLPKNPAMIADKSGDNSLCKNEGLRIKKTKFTQQQIVFAPSRQEVESG